MPQFTEADEAQNAQINKQGKKEQSLEARVTALEEKSKWLDTHEQRLGVIEAVIHTVKRVLGIRD